MKRLACLLALCAWATGAAAQHVTVVTPPPSSSQNRLCNGDFLIDQVNNGAATTPNTLVYAVDCWGTRFTQNAKLTFQRDTVAPPGFINSLKISVGTQSTLIPSDQLSLGGVVSGLDIEDLGFGTATPQTITVSGWLFAPTATGVTGNYSISLSAATRLSTYVHNCNVPALNTWTYCTWTLTGPTTGTWLTTSANAMQLRFDFGAGSTSQCAPDIWSTAANCVEANTGSPVQLVTQTAGTTLEIGNWRVYRGAADVPYAAPPYGQQLAQVQRYYQTSIPSGTAVGQSAGVAGATCVQNPIAAGEPSTYVPFRPFMNSTPTVTTYNPSAANANWRDVTASADVTRTLDPTTAVSADGVEIASGATVATLGDHLCIHWSADARLTLF